MVRMSYYNSPKVRGIPSTDKINIARTQPWYLKEEITNCAELYPTEGTRADFKNKLITWNSFENRYIAETLMYLDPEEVYSKLKGKVMLCHCKDNCHRFLIAEWLRNAGYEVEEL